MAAAAAAFPLPASYVGSASCKTCHSQIYERWQKTLMANVVRDPREHPDMSTDACATMGNPVLWWRHP